MNENRTEFYYQRVIRWSDKSINQLFYFNNLLFTLSIAFLSFAFEKKDFEKISFTTSEINWSLTFQILSVTLITMAVILGLVIIITRLIDYQVTRHINQTRYRVHKYTGNLLDGKTPDDFKFFVRQVLILKSFKRIKLEHCKKYEYHKIDVDNNFRHLRNFSHNLGLLTWAYTKNQSFVFALSIILYFLSIISIF